MLCFLLRVIFSCGIPLKNSSKILSSTNGTAIWYQINNSYGCTVVKKYGEVSAFPKMKQLANK